jgi:hypothetical protein
VFIGAFRHFGNRQNQGTGNGADRAERGGQQEKASFHTAKF